MKEINEWQKGLPFSFAPPDHSRIVSREHDYGDREVTFRKRLLRRPALDIQVGYTISNNADADADGRVEAGHERWQAEGRH